MVLYKFSHWEDGSTNPTRTFTVIADITIRAYYVTVERAVTFESTPIAVRATIDGQSVPSGGAVLVVDGITITITVPTEVEA